MKASVMDLRYRTKEVLRALEGREEITLTHRGKAKGKIVPADGIHPASPKITDHEAIGMWADHQEPVPALVARIRKPRP